MNRFLFVTCCAALIAAWGCGDDDGAAARCNPDRLLVVTAALDYSAAGAGFLDLGTGTVAMHDEPLGDTDSVAVLAGCEPVILERGAGVVRFVGDADSLSTAPVLDLDPTSEGVTYSVNPQAFVQVAEDKAYVPAGSTNAVLVVDPSARALTGSIDLGPLASELDTDGVVDQSGAIAVGDRLYVALARYYFDESFGIHFDAGAVLAVIDTTTDTLVDVDPATEGVQGIELMGENPWRGLVHDPATGSLLVGCGGDSFAIDGGVERVDLATLTSQGFVVSETDLGAELNGFALASANRLLVLAGTDVVVVDPADGGVAGAPLAAGVDGLLLHEGTLFTWSRGDAPGLSGFDALTGAATLGGAPLAFGDLPVSSAAPAP